MSHPPIPNCTAFRGDARLAHGPRPEVALAVKAALESDPTATILVFDDGTGRAVDFDLRGTPQDIVARLQEPRPPAEPLAGPPVERGRGRPKLGVVAREVTLLPRHWEWLAAQPGGASQALRRLVEEARRSDGGRSRARRAQETAYAFISAMAGNREGFEEASRALFAGDAAGFAAHSRSWPPDIRAHAEALAADALRAG
ncbi:MAG: DUF2239 family protein [Bosea sp. (in: a-proteobacteria)]|uniref:DUF2239 family protein n=1 Tax=Bosea sp. (in: a-proteobacteria) TaxID=1871050 RepID=UPI003F7C5B85